MATITDPDYETLKAVCDHCGATCLFNRAQDLLETRPVDGRMVNCIHCQREFWISGDIASPRFKLFILDAERHFIEKRYMLCVASLAQAWEVFFSDFARHNYLLRPYSQTCEDHRCIETLNLCQAQLDRILRKATFVPLRNLLVNTVIRNVHPRSLTEAPEAIERISTEGLTCDAGKKAVRTVPDSAKRKLLRRLRGVKVGELRNRVVHKSAYRPQVDEVLPCKDSEIALLYQLRDALQVKEADSYLNAAGRERWT